MISRFENHFFFAFSEYPTIEVLKEAIEVPSKYPDERHNRVMYYSLLWEMAESQDIDASQLMLKHYLFSKEHKIPIEDILEDYLIQILTNVLKGIAPDEALNFKNKVGNPKSDRAIDEYWGLAQFLFVVKRDDQAEYSDDEIQKQINWNGELAALLSNPLTTRDELSSMVKEHRRLGSFIPIIKNGQLLEKTYGIGVKAVKNRLKRMTAKQKTGSNHELAERAIQRASKYL